MLEKTKNLILAALIIIGFIIFFLWIGYDYYSNLSDDDWERIENSPEQGSGPYRW